MIDINELRQSLGAVTPEEIAELIDRLEAAESDALEQARLNGMGSEREASLLAKQEAAEKESSALKIRLALIYQEAGEHRETIDRIIAERNKLSDELDIERMRLAACGVAALGHFAGCAKEYRSASLDDVLTLHAENEELRAKIERMERQEPVAWTTQLALELGSSALGFDACRGNLWGDKGVPLYALPGAKGEEK